MTNKLVTLTRGNMIFKCQNIGRGYGGLTFVFTELCFIAVLVTQDVYAYPYRNDQDGKNTVLISDISRDSDIDETQNELKRLIENDRSYNSARRFQRDTSSNEDSDISNVSIKILSRGQPKEDSSQRRRTQLDGKIIFPGEIRQVPVCKESTYCEKVDSYPEDIVSKAIQRNDSLKYLAGVDVVSDIVQRIDVMDDVPLCVSTEQVIFPQSAENKDKEWKYIANQANFKQGIRIEKCSTESNSCSVIGGLAEGYKTTCKQKYVYRQLAAVLTDGTVVPDTFRFPSSCCCHVSFNGSPLTRIGVQQRSQITPTKTRRKK